MAILYAALGSNLGDKENYLKEAIKLIAAIKGAIILAKSSFYVTRPVGGPTQDDYLNGVIKIETNLSVENCLGEFKKIEKNIGRKERPRNYPREIDIDILFYDDRIINSADLVVPHPRLHEREFVLKGLNEIAPGLNHPIIGKTIKEIYRRHCEERHRTE